MRRLRFPDSVRRNVEPRSTDFLHIIFRTTTNLIKSVTPLLATHLFCKLRGEHTTTGSEIPGSVCVTLVSRPSTLNILDCDTVRKAEVRNLNALKAM